MILRAASTGFGFRHELRPFEQLEPFFGAGAGHPDDDRHFDVQALDGGEDATGDGVAARDAAEDVDEDALDVRVHEDDGEAPADGLFAGAAADVAEVGGRAALAGDHVQGAHDDAGAVAHDADVAGQSDVGDALAVGLGLDRVFFGLFFEAQERLVAEEGVVVDVELGVGGDDLAVLEDHEGVDLGEGGVAADEDVVELLGDVDELAAGLRVDAGALGEVSELEVPGAVGDVDDLADDGVGVGFRDLFDVDAAFGATDHDRRL